MEGSLNIDQEISNLENNSVAKSVSRNYTRRISELVTIEK